MTSFISMQVIRYAISGEPPDPEEAEAIQDIQGSITIGQIISLLGCGLFAAAIVVVFTYVFGADEGEEEEEEELTGLEWFKLRSYQLFMKFLTFLSALCFLYTIDWTLHSMFASMKGTLFIKVLVAMVCSCTTYAVVLGVGRIDNILLMQKSVAGHQAA